MQHAGDSEPHDLPWRRKTFRFGAWFTQGRSGLAEVSSVSRASRTSEAVNHDIRVSQNTFNGLFCSVPDSYIFLLGARLTAGRLQLGTTAGIIGRVGIYISKGWLRV